MPKSGTKWKTLEGEVGPAGMPDYVGFVDKLIEGMAMKGWAHSATTWRRTKDGMKYKALFRKDPKAR